MKKANTPKEKFAVLYAQESVLWKLCSDNKWPDNLRKSYRAFCDKVQEAVKQLPNRHNIRLVGFDNNPDISHYDIDEDLNAEFKSKICSNSESGQFFAYCNSRNQAAIQEWLSENYPTLDLEFTKVDDPSNPYFVNWNGATDFCKKKGFKVELPEGVVNLDTLKEVDNIQESIDELKIKRDILLNSL